MLRAQKICDGEDDASIQEITKYPLLIASAVFVSSYI